MIVKNKNITYSTAMGKWVEEDEYGNIRVLEPKVEDLQPARQPMKRYRAKRKTKPLTEKEKKFIGKMAQGYPANRAAYEAYNAKTLESASSIAAHKMKNPNIREKVLEVLERKGIDLDVALEPLVKSLKAKKNIIQDGELVTTNIDDLDLQLKASDRALKLMGVSQTSKGETVGNNYIQINNLHKSQYDEE